MNKRKMEDSNLKWQLDDDGIMVVECKGSISNFIGKNKVPPWEECKDLIQHLVIADGVTAIGACAFQECKSLVSVDFPKSLRRVDYNAFYRCSSLNEVIIPEGIVLKHSSQVDKECKVSQHTLIMKRQAFFGTPWAKKMWGDFFIDRRNLLEYYGEEEEVVIPEGIRRISKFAFKDKPITAVTFPDSLEEIDDFAFEGTKLKSFDLPEGVKSVGYGAFAGNKELESVYVFNDNAEMHENAFHGCEVEVQGHGPSKVQKWCKKSGVKFRKNHKRVERFRRIPDFIEDDCPGYMIDKVKSKYIILTIMVNEETKQVEWTKSYDCKMDYEVVDGYVYGSRQKFIREYILHAPKYDKYAPYMEYWNLKECESLTARILGHGPFMKKPYYGKVDWQNKTAQMCRCESYYSWEINKFAGKLEPIFIEWWLEQNPGYTYE